MMKSFELYGWRQGMIIFNKIDKRKSFRILFLFLYIFCAVFILDIFITLLLKLFNKSYFDLKGTSVNNIISEKNEYLNENKENEHNKIVYQEIDHLLKKNLADKALDLFCNSLIVVKNDEKYFLMLHKIKQKLFNKKVQNDFVGQNNKKENIRKLLSKNPENIDLLVLDAQYITAFSQHKYQVNIDEEDFDQLIYFSRYLEQIFSSKEYLKNNFNLPKFVKKNYKEHDKLLFNSALNLFKKNENFKKQYGNVEIEFIPNDLLSFSLMLKEWLIQFVYDFFTFLVGEGYSDAAKTYLELYFDIEMYSNVSIADYIALSELNEQFEKLDKELNYIQSGKLNNNLELDEDIYEERAYWWGLDGWQFEQQVAKVFEAIGYKTDVTKGSGDGGVDIILTKDNYRAIVQCKHHTDPVGPEAVRALYGVKKDFRADEVIMVASVGVTPSGYEFIKDKSDYKLYTLDDIIKMSEKFLEE